MKHYLSFCGGVNSVAYYVFLEELGYTFGHNGNIEAIFVDHRSDWPETYQYIKKFIDTGRPVTILKPDANTVEGVRFDSLVEYAKHKKVTPSRITRWCTDRFKIVPIYKYVERPCTMHIGFASDEAHRAVFSSKDGVENRFLLIEYGITRDGCISLIEDAGLNVPDKSGCYICPFQGVQQFKQLRKKYPDLFCDALKIETQQNQRTTKDGRPWKPYYLCGVPLDKLDKQKYLPTMEKEEFPPCFCGL